LKILALLIFLKSLEILDRRKNRHLTINSLQFHYFRSLKTDSSWFFHFLFEFAPLVQTFNFRLIELYSSFYSSYQLISLVYHPIDSVPLRGFSHKLKYFSLWSIYFFFLNIEGRNRFWIFVDLIFPAMLEMVGIFFKFQEKSRRYFRFYFTILRFKFFIFPFKF
jgi:hypothetical protein